MASPASTAPSSAYASQQTSPEIRIMDDHGQGRIIHLPEPIVDPVRGGVRAELPLHAPKTQPLEANGIRPVPARVMSAEDTTAGYANAGPLAPTSEPLSTAKQLKQRPDLNRQASGTGSLRLLGGFGRKNGNGGSSTSLFSKKPLETSKPSVPQSVDGSGSTPQTPEFHSLFSAANKCPDLNAVNRALGSLRQTRDEYDIYIVRLQDLANEMKIVQEDCKKLLTQAMQARDIGSRETCRGFCISIIHNQHAHTDTKVYAYNILSTMASSGQGIHFLEASEELALQVEEDADRIKMLGVIGMLKESLAAKEAKESNGKAPKASDELPEIGDIGRAPTAPKKKTNGSQHSQSPSPPSSQQQVTRLPEAKDFLKLPKDGEEVVLKSGAVTPTSEKILQWALPSRKKD